MRQALEGSEAMTPAQSASTANPLARYNLSIPPGELVRWLREEKDENHQHLELFLKAWKHYSCEEDFDHAAYGVPEEDRVDLVTMEAILNVEPLVEMGYWILQVQVRDRLGIMDHAEEAKYDSGDLTLEQFESEILGCRHDHMKVVVMAPNDDAKGRFDHWFDTMKARHGLHHSRHGLHH